MAMASSLLLPAAPAAPEPRPPRWSVFGGAALGSSAAPLAWAAAKCDVLPRNAAASSSIRAPEWRAAPARASPPSLGTSNSDQGSHRYVPPCPPALPVTATPSALPTRLLDVVGPRPTGTISAPSRPQRSGSTANLFHASQLPQPGAAGPAAPRDSAAPVRHRASTSCQTALDCSRWDEPAVVWVVIGRSCDPHVAYATLASRGT